MLVAAQVAGSLVLVAGAALFLRSQQGAMEMDLGFDPERIAVTSKRLAPEEYTPEAGLQYVRELMGRLSALPGVEEAQAARGVELTFLGAFNSEGEVRPEGTGHTSGTAVTAHSNAVTPGYLRMLKVPLLRGRTLQDGDAAGAPAVAVVNQTFARRLWPDGEALGQRFSRRRKTEGTHERGWNLQTFEVVGVTRDGKYLDIDDGPTPYFWTSLYQDYSPHLAILVRGIASAETMVPLLRREVPLAENELSLMPPSTLSGALDLQRLHLRVASTVLGWGGLFGLVLAVIGIYGIVSFAVTQRGHELAIRMAIGAQRGQVLRMVLRDGLALAVVGLGAGVTVLVPLAWLVRSQLFGIGPADPVALGASAAVILSAALAASLIPASRATRIDPMRTLRDE
jgi:predicted permease